MLIEIMPVVEIVDIARKVQLEKEEPDFSAAMLLPVPRIVGATVEAWVGYYIEWGLPGQRIVEPLSHLMRLSAEDGSLIALGPTSLARLGVAVPPPPVPGVDFDPTLDGAGYAQLEGHLLAISRSVWQMFVDGRPPYSPAVAPILQSYREAFARVVKAPVAPFYIALSEDFFRYVGILGAVP